jgi:hypothetical protein
VVIRGFVVGVVPPAAVGVADEEGGASGAVADVVDGDMAVEHAVVVRLTSANAVSARWRPRDVIGIPFKSVASTR